MLAASALDPTFGQRGLTLGPLAPNFPGVYVQVTSSGAVQDDGKVLAVSGYTAPGGSGVGIAVERYNTDGTPDASFGVNGIDVGLFCATPGVALSRNILPKQAMEMLLTGDFISAEEARVRGLVNRVVAPDALDAELAVLVDRIVAKPREAIAMGKTLFYRQLETGIESAYQLAGQTMACNMVHGVAQEGVQSFIDKRPPTWRA